MTISLPVLFLLGLLATPSVVIIAVYAIAVVFGIIAGLFDFVLRVMKR